ncbi:hypothetical protein QZH41_017915 [Actinostola sp. cb2023]|nr:hypothetical protein QZH41_017915 [Actinostola sp. cb2023]
MLSDFKKNWTIIKLPKKNQCFLQALNPVTPPPQQLVSNIQKDIALNGTNSTINIDITEKSSWKAKSVPFNRLLLTDEMRKLCLNAPVYEITRLTGQVYVKGFQRQGRSSKYPRSACGGYVCSYYWQWYCTQIRNGNCVWVKVKVWVCETITC